jgi:alpha-1,6-mannosyltransferase
MNKNSILLGLSALLLVWGTSLMVLDGDVRQAETLHRFGWAVSIMGLGFVLSWLLESVSGLWFWGVAIATRLVLLRAHPGDEVWRFLWEGYIQTFGFNPYTLAPNAAELVPYRTEWWSQIAHPNLLTIDPPLAQLAFRLLAAIAPSVLLFKLAFTLADLALCGLLCRRFGPLRATFYAWNPLILYAFAGGAHDDSWFILPLAAAWLVFENPQPGSKPPGSDFMQALREAFADEDERLSQPLNSIQLPAVSASPPRKTEHWLGSAFLLGVSAAFKGMSWPILGFLAWRAVREVGLKLATMVVLCSILPLAIAALPFCLSGECPLGLANSDLRFGDRAVAFLPALLSGLWPNNWVYLFVLAIAFLGMLWQFRHFRPFAEWYFLALLALSPIVHAWSLTWLVPFAVASRNLGTYWVSLSAFFYFILPYRQASGSDTAHLSLPETLALWLPLVVGWLWTSWQQSRAQSWGEAEV